MADGGYLVLGCPNQRDRRRDAWYKPLASAAQLQSWHSKDKYVVAYIDNNT